MAMHFSGRLVQLARSAMERFTVGVAKTVRGGAMRSSSHRISSLDSSSSGTQSMTRSASRTASSMVETKSTAGQRLRTEVSLADRFAGVVRDWRASRPQAARESRRGPRRSASQRPSGPAPMMATVVTSIARTYLAARACGHFLGAGAAPGAGARPPWRALRGEGGDGRQHAAQGHGDIVNVVHQADGFSGKRHGFLKCSVLIVGRGGLARNREDGR